MEASKPKLAPFVKWAGGKRQLLLELTARMPDAYGRYFEPFVGGGALLLHLQPERAVINDVNPQLVNAYRQLQKNADAVIAEVRRLDSRKCDNDYYLNVRSAYNAMIAAHRYDAESAAAMIWISKHCFNGLYRVNSKGLFNTPFNGKTSGVSMNEENLLGVGEYLYKAQVDIREVDFEDACADVTSDDFVFFDSPYIPSTKTEAFTDYTQRGFGDADHKRLASLYRHLNREGAKMLLSNRNVPLVYELYDGFRIDMVNVRRSINPNASGRKGQEVIIANF